MTSSPTDLRLYHKVKKSIYRKYPQHSAYRSGLLVQAYKKEFQKQYGSRRSPYRGKRSPRTGLARWYQEKWTNQRGEIGYRYKSDVYRPSRRITSKTPTTFRELGKKRISQARRKKASRGRVNRF